MDDRTKMARSYLRGITTKAEFNSLLDTEYIACEIGYSTLTVKAVHKRVLQKVSNFIYLTSSSK